MLDAKLSVESFKKGWIALPLSNGALGGIAEATTGKAVLRPRSDGTDLLLPDKGVYDITLRLMLPIEQTAGKSRTTLALPTAAVSKLVITVPGDGLEFEVKPSAAFTTRPLAGQTELSFFFGSISAKPELTWGAPQGVTQMTPLLLADTKLESKLGAGSIATTANFDFRILRAPMGEFKVGIPAGSEVLGVTGDNVKTWNVATVGGRQMLTVSPDKPVKDSYAFQLQLEGPIAALPVEVNVPELSVEGASYARGTATIYSEPQFDVTPKTLEAVVRSSTQAQAKDQLMAVGSFRVLKQPYKLSLAVEEAKPQVEVTSLTRLDIQRDATKVEASLAYNVRRVGIFETRITLPAGLNVSAVTGDQVSEWKVETTGTTSTLLVKLPQQKTGDFTIHLTGRQPAPRRPRTRCPCCCRRDHTPRGDGRRHRAFESGDEHQRPRRLPAGRRGRAGPTSRAEVRHGWPQPRLPLSRCREACRAVFEEPQQSDQCRGAHARGRARAVHAPHLDTRLRCRLRRDGSLCLWPCPRPSPPTSASSIRW